MSPFFCPIFLGHPKARADEIETGGRLAVQQGLRLIEGTHVGHDYVAVAENGAKTTIDAIGRPGAFSHGNPKQFFSALMEHIDLKSVDKIAIDLKYASKEQIKAIKTFVQGLTKDQQGKIIYVN
jgi:hypothetical protein